MRKNLPVSPRQLPGRLPERLFCPLFFLALFAAGNVVSAQNLPLGETIWYRSNSSGMTLERLPSRLAAQRNEYSIAVRSALYREVPELLLPYYNNSYSTELRVLYNEDAISRRQWIFRDQAGTTRLTASGGGSRFAARGAGALASQEDDSNSGIIEFRNSSGDVTREIQFDNDLSEWDYRYNYRDGVLFSTEIWFKPAPPAETEGESAGIAPVFALAYTDNYRYTRSGSLRAIDRTIHEGAAEQQRIAFPRLGPGVPSVHDELITHGSAYTSGYFIGNESPEEGVTISYSLDSRGRVLGEIWRDENGVVIGELTNTWSGDNRLLSVLWKTETENRLIEYEYDNRGDRIVERNFSHGVLERIISNQDGIETEDIFINGVLMLRAYWENGQKIREERPGERFR